MTATGGFYPVLEGLVVINSTNKAIRLTENGVTETVNVVEGEYTSLATLAAAVATALTTHSQSNTYASAVTYSRDHDSAAAAISLSQSGGNTFAILWSNAATTFDEGLIGFANSGTANSALAKASTLSPSCIWIGNDLVRSIEPIPEWRRTLSRARSGKTRAAARMQARDRFWAQENIHAKRMHEEHNTSDPTACLSRFLERHADGKRFVMTEATISSGDALTLGDTVGTFVFGDEFYPQGGELGVRRDGAPLYSFSGRLLPYVA